MARRSVLKREGRSEAQHVRPVLGASLAVLVKPGQAEFKGVQILHKVLAAYVDFERKNCDTGI